MIASRHNTRKGAKRKQEALTVQRFIHEILVNQLSIPIRQIVNDTTFAKYTGSQRPDILISEFEYDTLKKNDDQFISNLVAYSEAKDDCSVGDAYWQDAFKQGMQKAPLLKLPYFMVTNCKTSVFYNATTGKEMKLNGNPLREFQTIDIMRLIKNRLIKTPELENIITNVDSRSVISEAVFNKKLWELKKIYRNVKFDNNVQVIDFTIGFVALEYFEERIKQTEGKLDSKKIYWTDCRNAIPERTVANLTEYITRLQREQFGEFSSYMEKVKLIIHGDEERKPLISNEEAQQIYDVIESMKPLHESGFDLFGAIYEMFADPNEKKEFGQYYTRRHYCFIFAKLLLKNETYFNKDKKFTILDPACGTGGFLTEGFKVLKSAYASTNTLTSDGVKFLENDCFWGVDVKGDNIARTKLNMFLVGDGHTHMKHFDTLEPDEWEFEPNQKWRYIMTNPPVGAGTKKAESSVVSSNRTEIAFLYKVIKLLQDGGRACILLPDGVLENPIYRKLRKDFLEKCIVESIISMPKFAFAPYTKEPMHAVFFTKKNENVTKIQKEPIWMYIIDNDGLANSDKRFPTRLRNNRNGWLHDEISGWVSTEGDEMSGVLEEHWMKYDDSVDDGTEWLTEKGETTKLRKAGFIPITSIEEPTAYYCLLPEYYLRPSESTFITFAQLSEQVKNIEAEVRKLSALDADEKSN